MAVLASQDDQEVQGQGEEESNILGCQTCLTVRLRNDADTRSPD